MIAFAFGQPAIQLLNVATGFLLLRWLSVADYAQFGTAVAFQAMILMLSDLGFTGSVIALSGDRAKDPNVLGGYIRTAMHFRTTMSIAILILFALVFPLLTHNHPWGITNKVLLFSAIAATVFFQAWNVYGAPLLIHRELRIYHSIQIWTGVVRLMLTLFCYVGGVLNAWVAVWIAAIAVAANGWMFRKGSLRFIREPQVCDPSMKREMLQYMSPQIPAIIFTAFQGPMLVALTAWFGTTRNIAEVAALGRLGAFFGILFAFNSLVAGPYIAAIPASLLPRRYLQVLAATVFLAGAVSGLGWLFPGPALWLLGKSYQNLGVAASLAISTASISYISGVIYTMNSARKWVFWWGGPVEIVILITVQITGLRYMNLNTAAGVMLFGLFTASALIFVHGATCVWGFAKGSPYKPSPEIPLVE